MFNSYLPIYADNSLHGIYSIMHDISDKKQAQQQLRMAEEKAQLLSQAIEQAGDAVIITNREGSIEFVNAAFTRITGFRPDEAIGNTPAILKSGEQDQAFYARMWSSISRGETWQSRLVDRRKNGQFYPAELTISPVLNREAEITHFIGIKRDLTEREELQEKFHQAQKMEAIGTLVGGIAHDFNNMLAGMTGNLYLATQKSQGNPEVMQKLERIEQLSRRAADMIQQLLTFARKGRVSMQEMPFVPFIKETMKLLHTSVPENVDLQLDICSDEMIIRGDATQLHQLLMNLFSNARDAVEQTDNPHIHVRLEKFHADKAWLERHVDAKADTYAHLGVADNGCGIPAHQIRHLFEPFFTTKEEGKGTGLGLAMAFGAIKTHQGFIEVNSAPGVGSTFHIYIPLVERPGAEMTASQGQDVAEGHGETILLADDELHILETGREVLEVLGYRVLTATDGRQAVEIFEARHADIDLCILDVVMPVISGDQVAERIRRKNPEMKIIFSTGYDKYLQTDMKHETVLSKPFSIAQMSQLIRRQLDVT